MKTNIKLIQYLSDNNLLRSYSVWLKLKHIHVNSTYYNWSLSKLSKDSGISRNGIRKYIILFERLKWIRIKNNHLTFISHDKLKNSCGVKLKFDLTIIPGSVKDILSALRYEILKNKQRHFDFIKDKLVNLSNPQGIGALNKYKAAKKACIKHGLNITGEQPSYLKITLSKLKGLLNLSASTISRLIKQFEAVGKAIVIRGEQKVICRVNKRITLNDNMYQYKGCVISVECNKYQFL